MDIIQSDLEWEYDSESGLLIAFNSEVRDYSIDLDCKLTVYYLDGDIPITSRQCIDDDHAKAIADSFERQAIRDRERGESWRGVKVDDRSEPL